MDEKVWQHCYKGYPNVPWTRLVVAGSWLEESLSWITMYCSKVYPLTKIKVSPFFFSRNIAQYSGSRSISPPWDQVQVGLLSGWAYYLRPLSGPMSFNITFQAKLTLKLIDLVLQIAPKAQNG